MPVRKTAPWKGWETWRKWKDLPPEVQCALVWAFQWWGPADLEDARRLLGQLACGKSLLSACEVSERIWMVRGVQYALGFDHPPSAEKAVTVFLGLESQAQLTKARFGEKGDYRRSKVMARALETWEHSEVFEGAVGPMLGEAKAITRWAPIFGVSDLLGSLSGLSYRSIPLMGQTAYKWISEDEGGLWFGYKLLVPGLKITMELRSWRPPFRREDPLDSVPWNRAISRFEANPGRIGAMISVAGTVSILPTKAPPMHGGETG